MLKTTMHDTGVVQTVQTVQFEEEVLQRVVDERSSSPRHIPKDMNTKSSTIHCSRL
ncbi:hypothetical protein FQR65_LT08874 [Abscondita terminalis]|nr:hypothetical protein FQR65_LT08874 [Abscondita terminalis]